MVQQALDEGMGQYWSKRVGLHGCGVVDSCTSYCIVFCLRRGSEVNESIIFMRPMGAQDLQ